MFTVHVVTPDKGFIYMHVPCIDALAAVYARTFATGGTVVSLDSDEGDVDGDAIYAEIQERYPHMSDALDPSKNPWLAEQAEHVRASMGALSAELVRRSLEQED